ncbi:MAG: lipopolysaccharide biosynthesis protein [Ignavibacteriaceae bacterium]|jgi:O-antigen/teichoic acid export membrane protein
MTETLTHKTFHGLKWSYISIISTAAMQIGYTSIMARLLTPKAFGLMAMGGVIIGLGGYFAEMGLGHAIIQKNILNKNDIKASFSTSIILGIFFWLLIYLCAPLAILIFKDSEVVNIIRVLGIYFIINGFSLTSKSLLRRELNFKALAIIEICSYLTGYIFIGISFALLGWGVWSLVIASLGQQVTSALISFLIVKHKISFVPHWNDIKPLFNFGSKISIISFIQFISSNLDTLIIGKISTPTLLGIYNRASLFVNLPAQYFYTSFSRVLFPAFSRIQLDKDKLREIFTNSFTLINIIILPLTIGVVPMAKDIIYILLGPNWTEAIPVFQVLIITIAFSAVINISGSLIQATGKLRGMFYNEIAYLILLIGLMLMFSTYGLLGFAIAMTISKFIRLCIYILIIKNNIKPNLYNIFKALAINAFVGVLIACIIFIANHFITGNNLAFKFILELIILLITYVLFLRFIIARNFAHEFSYLLMIMSGYFNKNLFLNNILYYLEKKLIIIQQN